MITNKDLQIRDPFVVPVASEKKYYLFGSTDANIWGKGTGFDAYVSEDLEHWEGPYPVFRPQEDFYSSTNYWAPEVYAYKERYYMFATFRRNDNNLLGTAVLVADSLLGPYEPHSNGPVTPEEWSSLDGTLFIDEKGDPWMIFCHEWQQVADGEVCALRLTADLNNSIGTPVLLFRASEAAWTTSFIAEKYQNQENYVTDGPYLFYAANGELLMLWASFIDNRYALGIAKSQSGSVLGPWKHESKSLYQNDGGHAMVFRDFEQRLLLAIHTPNQTPYERPVFLEIIETNSNLQLSEL